MMKKVRLMNRPEDYKRLGVNPNQIEMWEDKRRDTSRSGHWEWWYFDALLDDGTAVVIQFFSKAAQFRNIDYPSATIKVTLPDGKHYEKEFRYPAKDGRFGKDRCDVQIGAHSFRGDFKTYNIHVEPLEGLGADIRLTSLAQPYRPGSAYFGFGDHDEQYYTWLCAVPKGEVTGALTVNGKKRQIHGFGYHDHQWGSNVYMTLWNHWLWARQGFDDYSLLVFDMVSDRKYGYERIPIIFIEDKDGNIVFESNRDVKYELLSDYRDEKSGKKYPKSSRYTFCDGVKQVEYTVTENKVLENTLASERLSFLILLLFKALGMNPSYTRYAATGTLRITEAGRGPIERTGRLIYEFMYPGKSFHTNKKGDQL